MCETTPKKPIRFIMLGGFLGAGKTTALLRLAGEYAARGKRVGIITNDQAEGLVDTLAFRGAGFTTEEIPSGCFCCHFEKLLEASGRLADGLDPDIILAEPVGSCTDLVNAVITPLKRLYADRFTVAPYAVLVDPERALEALAGVGARGFSQKITYLYKMQQNEADIIAINKIDRLTATELEAVVRLVQQNFPKSSRIPISALTGDGFSTLIPYLDQEVESGQHPADINYERYTEGEVALGWLNARARLSSDDVWDGDKALGTMARRIQRGLTEARAEVAHFKMRLIAENGREGAIHITSSTRESETAGTLGPAVQTADLVVNLRAEADPRLLEKEVRAALEGAASDWHLNVELVHCDAFAPSAPVPPPASRNTVRV